jgi:hypothetical protein
MARLFRCDRVEFDVAVTDARGAPAWQTAEVERTPEHERDGDGLRAYGAALVRPLREFAERTTAFAPHDAAGYRYERYQLVRAVVRDPRGTRLAEIRADGTVTVPVDLDPERRRQFIGMLNGRLPMVIRELDRGSYAAALSTLASSRALLDTMLREVMALAVVAPDGLDRDGVAAALGVDLARLDDWYRSQDPLG